MADGLYHAFVSAISDSTDTTLVRPTNWNANHELIGKVTLLSSSGATGDVVIARQTSGILSIAQTSTTTTSTNAASGLRVYNFNDTLTSSSTAANYERGVFDW